MLAEILSTFESLPSRELICTAGSRVFARDSRVEWLHLVRSGEAQLVRFTSGGSTVVLQHAEAGHFLAEASLFSEHYHCDAVVVVDCAITRFRKPEVLKALSSEPGFATAWARYLSHEVQRTRARAEMLAQRRLVDRLAAWLEAHAGAMPPRGQWVGLARDIGVTPEALYRHLADSRRQPKG